VTQLQDALNAMSLTFAGISASWAGDFYDPESDRDDCHGCALNTRWAGSEHISFVGTVGSYDNSTWAGGTVLAVVVTLVDANADVEWSSGVVGGNAVKWITTQSYMRTVYQFGLGDPQSIVYVDNPSTTTVEDQHPFCQVSSPASP